MITLTRLSNDYKQEITTELENGVNLIMYFEFSLFQEAWYYDITYENFSLRGEKLIKGENILRKYRNIIPFGLRITTTDDLDPFFLNDFSVNRTQVHILNEDEVRQIEEAYYE